MLNGWQTLSAVDQRRVERGIVEGRVLGGPWHLEIQPTNLCNVDCFFCISKAGRRGESLDWPILRKLLETNIQRDLSMIRLTGGGDPLSYPQIRQLIDACGELGVSLENVTTNATRLAKLAPRIVEVGLDWITISLNESDPARYAKTMKASVQDYHRAVEGVRAMVAARDAAPPGRRPKIWVQFFIWKESAAHILEMYELGRELGADTIFMRTIIGKFGHEKLTEADRPGIEAQLLEIIGEDSRSGEFRLHFDVSHELNLDRFTYREQDARCPPNCENFPRFNPAAPRTEYCYVGWYTTSINARGDVFPCFQYREMDDKGVGNIYKSSLDEIWRGADYGLFRSQIRELVGLGGNMEPSRKYNRFIERKCVACEHCQYTFALMDPEFYARATPELERNITAAERLVSRGRNAAIHVAHRILDRPQ